MTPRVEDDPPDDTLYPWGYGRTLVTLTEIRVRLEPNYHPEYLRRLLLWLEAQGGAVGVGGHFRADGTQPSDPGFAPEGRSFHQNQQYDDGFVGACAVDLVVKNGSNVHRAPSWAEVPPQGSGDAELWGVHCNVGTPPRGEPWHMQPIEIDGWGSATQNGNQPAPAPVPNYGVTEPEPGTVPSAEEAPMFRYRHIDYADQFVVGAGAIHMTPTALSLPAYVGLEFIENDDRDFLVHVCRVAQFDFAELTPI